MKKGEKSAQLRTFFSKNDYISQDLTVEKVKWLTAAYDRMYDISLYEHHWDYKESTGRWTPNMFFWTDADIDRMRSFFKEWSTEKDVKDWTAVERFQDMVRQKRLDERHAKETNPIDSVMETVKEIPEDFKKWVSEKAMSFSRYLIYSARSKNEALVRCTHCNEVTLVDRTKIRLRNNEKGICPLCGSPVTIKARGRMPMHIWDERIVSFIEPREEGFLWRYFTAHREVKPDGKISRECKAKLNICFNFSCMKRAIEKSKFNSTFLEEAMEIQRMISCGVIMLMIDTTTISIVCWAIPDLFDRIGCDVLIFFHGIEQVFTNWQTPTIFSASDCKGIINNFLPTIHEVYQSAQRGCCMVRSINMDMDTT